MEFYGAGSGWYTDRVNSNPVYLLFATPKSFGPFLLRMLLAGIFLVYGGQKAFGWFGGAGWTATVAQWSHEEGLGLAAGLAALAIVGEILIAISMFMGFFTRLSALGVVAIMTGAIVLVHAESGLKACEFPLSLLVIGAALFFLGGGRLSIDRAIGSNLLPAVG